MTDVGGDPACWLDRVCERCGLVLAEGDDEEAHRCTDEGDRNRRGTGRGDD